MKCIALIAHDRVKADLVQWVKDHQTILKKYKLMATNHAGMAIREATGLEIQIFESGPMGGDVRISNQILEGNVDELIFFVDQLSPMPHDPDIRSLIRIATLKDIPFALNRATADLILK